MSQTPADIQAAESVTLDGGSYEADTTLRPEAAIDRVAEEAKSWGGQFDRATGTAGRLGLPVLAGLRRGWVAGQITAEPSQDGSHLRFTIDAGEYQIEKASVVVLTLALLGAFSFILAPFIPRLWSLVPIGFFIALGAWLFIIARLKNSGPEEFLEQVASISEPLE